MADSDEAARQHVQQKAPNKLIGMHGQEPLLVVVSGVAPAERYGVVDERNEAVVGNRDAMGVGAEVSEHLIGPSERRLTIDNPAQRVNLTDQAPEQSGLLQTANSAVEIELPGSLSLLERCYEFSTEEFGEDCLLEEETSLLVDRRGGENSMTGEGTVALGRRLA